jgi:VIT1/CCC1 family predicted Fe2+/Mn2+ transporter
MMGYELGLVAPDPRAALRSAATIAVSYVAGGLIPLGPYFATGSIGRALGASVATTVGALAIFGYVKGAFTGARPLRSALQTTAIGCLAAGAAFALARLFS